MFMIAKKYLINSSLKFVILPRKVFIYLLSDKLIKAYTPITHFGMESNLFEMSKLVPKQNLFKLYHDPEDKYLCPTNGN